MPVKVETTITCDTCRKKIKAKSRTERYRPKRHSRYSSGGHKTVLTHVYQINDSMFDGRVFVERGCDIYDSTDDVKIYCSVDCVMKALPVFIAKLKPDTGDDDDEEV